MTKTMIFPSRLKPGDQIGIVAPSSPILACGEKGIKRGHQYLENEGFRIVEHPQCRLETGHTAGSIKQRVSALHQFFRNSRIKAIMAFWGGQNSNQLLEYLDYDLIRRNPKILIGFSDVTALLLAITQKTGLITFMGPGAISFAKPEPFDYTWKYFYKVCVKPEEKLKIIPSKTFADDAYYLRKDDNHRIIQKNRGFKTYKMGKAEGKIIAANLQTLLILLGTPYFPDLTDSVLFLEEAEEANTATVERFLTQLRQAGVFKKIKGLVFGRFTTQTGFNKKDRFEVVLDNVLENYQIPTLYNVDFGHSDPLITIPNGGWCRINASKKEIVFNKAVL